MEPGTDAYYEAEAKAVLQGLLGHEPKTWPEANVLVETGRACEQTQDEEEFGELLSGAVEMGEEWAVALFRWVGVEIGLEGGPGQQTANA